MSDIFEFAYTNYRGETARRRVSTVGWRLYVGATWHPEPQLLLSAIDLDKGAVRDFAVRDMHLNAITEKPTGDAFLVLLDQTTRDQGKIILVEYDEGYVLRYHGETVWRSYGKPGNKSQQLSHHQTTGDPIPVADCCHCGRLVDTREEREGGDKHGSQLEDGRWTCSFECWEAATCDGTAEKIDFAELHAAADRELSAVSVAIGSHRFMDFPDGGDVPLGEQVNRMRQALEKTEGEVERLRGILFVADEALMTSHGCFPLDRVTAPQRFLHLAAKLIRAETSPDYALRFERVRQVLGVDKLEHRS